MLAGEKMIGRRYELGDRLGAGGMGAVYRALDRLTGHMVALKQVRSPEDGEGSSSRTESLDHRLALMHEFQTLASLRHPHIISVLDYGFADGFTPDIVSGKPIPDRLPYFTMDLLESAPTILDAAARLDQREKLRLIVQMLHALAYLHRRGVMHRDLKPGNVLVARDERGEPQVKLLDFGLALLKRRPSEGSSSSAAAGTFAYMAPEVLTGEGAVEASDLYSAGVIAYEMFSGRHPFQGETVSQMISRVLNAQADTSPLNLTEDVQAVLQRLLAKQPSARYTSATEAVEALCAAAKLDALSETAAIRESFLQAAEFVGREREMDLLTEALRTALDGHGSGWLVGGESGVGKTRLLNELRTRALVRGALVLRGQAARESSGPYSLWMDALRWLSLLTNPSEQEASVLKAVVPDISALLRREIPDAPELPPDAAQTRLMAVVGLLFRRMETPGMLILEDLQWSGRDSLALLSYINDMADDLPLLILGTYRDDETPDLPVALPGLKIMRLGRLDANSIAALSESMLGPAGRRREVIDLLGRETEGNAFFVVEVVRALAEEAGDLSDVGGMALPVRVAAGGVEQLIQRRLDRVPADARPLLEAAAVAGRWLDLDLIDRLMLGSEPDPAAEGRLARQLVECADAAVFDVQSGRWCFAHDKLREAVLDTLSAERAAVLHRKVAESIEEMLPDPDKRASTLAFHWREAGEEEKEAHYALIAGGQLVDTSAYQDALPYLERALELVRRQGTGTVEAQLKQVPIRHQMARTYWALSEFDKAQQQHADNLAISTQLGDRRGMALAHRGLGDVAESRGDYSSAREHFEASLALSEAGNYRDYAARARHALGRILEKTGDYLAAEKSQLEALAISREIGDRRLEGDVYRVLGSLSSMQGRYEEAASHYHAALAIYREMGNRRGMAGALNNLGVNAEALTQFAQAAKYYDESLTIKREIGDRRGMAITLSNIGTAAYYARELNAARRTLSESLAIFEQVGDRQGVADALNNLGLVDYDDRQYDDAREKWRDSLNICEEIGDQWGVALAHLNIAKTYREESDFVQSHSRFLDALRVAHEIQKHPTTLEILQEYAVLMFNQGKDERAAELLAFVLAHPRTPGPARKRAEVQCKVLETKLPIEVFAAAQARSDGWEIGAVVEAILRNEG